jgi:hypothetical protein
MITNIIGVQEALKGGIIFKLDNERTVKFWADRWNDYWNMKGTFSCLYMINSKLIATIYDMLVPRLNL